MNGIKILTAMCLLGASVALGATESVVNSKHNLSASGPGAVRATSEQQVCIFCHTPHHASHTEPLWNRTVLPKSYRPYSSNSLDAKPGQPTGTSKLCLSCHDGTIALGSVVSRNQQISMASGATTIPPGKTNLGTDLSDDHPISFKYDTALQGKDPKLKDPRSLPTGIKLDTNSELQCTTCHDAHDNSKGQFLVMDNSGSQLCSSCHTMGTTNVNGHTQCASCHQQHTAPSGPFLLKAAKVADTCGQCHSGGTTGLQGPNVIADVTKISRHDTSPPVNLPTHVPSESDCTDCHGSHTMTTATAVAPNIPGNFGKVKGMNTTGAEVAEASYEYEVCYKCHADNNSRQPYIARQIVQNNTRLEFASNAISFHPVTTAGKSSDNPSLLAPYTSASILYCSDCHVSDTSKKAGGTGADGTHGSNTRPLLVARYETKDNTSESASAYALCYRCHNRANILSEQSSFKHHKKHVQDKKTPCSACHDGHGISSSQGTATGNSRLINFDTTIAKPYNGRLEFQDTGTRHGRCYTTCHSKDHNGLSY